MVLLAAAAYFRGGLFLSWVLILSLAPAFAAFSRFSSWELALPLLLVTAGFSSLQKRLDFTGPAARGFLLTVLVIADLAFRWVAQAPEFAGGRPDGQDGIWSLATVFLGALVFPLSWEGVRRSFDFLVSRGRRPGQVSFFGAWMRRTSGDGEGIRRPFGLEKRI
jgi:hypothetical protein